MSTQTAEFKSNQGQQAGILRLQFDELTDNERKIVVLLSTPTEKTERPVMSIKEIMEALNWHRIPGGRARGNSRVRNTMRRLVRSKWVGHKNEVGDGLYRITALALSRLEKLVESGEATEAKAPRKARQKKATPAVIEVETEQAAPTESKDETKQVIENLAESGLTIDDVKQVVAQEF